MKQIFLSTILRRTSQHCTLKFAKMEKAWASFDHSSTDNGQIVGDSSNVSICRPIFEPSGNPFVAAFSILSILFNSVVILVIWDMGKRKITSSTRLFLALAISDMTMAVFFTIEAVMNWSCDSCTVGRSLIHGVDIMETLAGNSNKGVTLYITLKRALAVSSTLKVSRRKSLISTVMELMIFAIIGCIPLFIILPTEGKYLFDFGIRIVWLVYFTLLSMVMTVLAIFIFCKLRNHNKLMSSNLRHTRSTTEDDFQKLVFLVAASFCCCHFFAIVLFSYALCYGRDEVTKSLIIWFNAGLALNAAVNLFIYIATSASFRRVLLGFCGRKSARSMSNVTQMSDISSSASARH